MYEKYKIRRKHGLNRSYGSRIFLQGYNNTFIIHIQSNTGHKSRPKHEGDVLLVKFGYTRTKNVIMKNCDQENSE